MDKSRRYCLDCKTVTTWKRPKKNPHSNCSKCGGRRSARRQDKDISPNTRAKYSKRGL